MSDKVRGVAYSSATCNCFAFILLLFASFSPYMLWGNYRYYENGIAKYTTVGTGPYIAGTIFSSTPVSWSTSIVYTNSWVYYSEVATAGVCSSTSTDPTNSIYTEWAKPNGFCIADSASSSGYSYQQLPEIGAAQGLGVSACVFAFIATMMGFFAAEKSAVGYSAVSMSFLAFVLATASYATYVNSPYFQQLRSVPTSSNPLGGGAIPLQTTTGKLLASTPVRLYWGPAFSSQIIASIILLFSTLSLFGVARQADDDSNGDFGAI